MTFDYSLDFANIDFRKHPELYRIGKGEQGVLVVEPYKSEILPYWRFKTPEVARKSANKIYKMFLGYKKSDDFVGMDMARKFLQMGYTRSRRYANHKSGRKYAKGSKKLLPREEDVVKAESAKIFYETWKKARQDKKYVELKKKHRECYESRSMTMIKVIISEDCGNSPKNILLKNLTIAFAKRDSKFILDKVIEDFRWNIIGDKFIQGKDNFAQAVEQMKNDKVTELNIHHIATHGRSGFVNGTTKLKSKKASTFCDVYEFSNTKGTTIKEITSYVIEIK